MSDAPSLSGAPLGASRAPARSTGRTHRILVAGGSGTIGRATVLRLVARGHTVVSLVRARGGAEPSPLVTHRLVDIRDADSILRDGIAGEPFDAVISCLASRTGSPADAWAIDHDAHLALLAAAQQARVPQFVLVSAICVQKPHLAFQHAKLAFERALIASGLRYSIVRPTAYFKSLSGQVARVRRGKPFLLVGDGRLTACTPISDDDLAAYIADCLDDPTRWDRILPIGGPQPAETPREQGERLFRLLGRPPRFRSVPIGILDLTVAVLSGLARVIPPLAGPAEFARIGRYYATESMLVWDETQQRYDASATPSTGRETLADYHARLLRGDVKAERAEHALF